MEFSTSQFICMWKNLEKGFTELFKQKSLPLNRIFELENVVNEIFSNGPTSWLFLPKNKYPPSLQINTGFAGLELCHKLGESLKKKLKQLKKKSDGLKGKRILTLYKKQCDDYEEICKTLHLIYLKIDKTWFDRIRRKHKPVYSLRMVTKIAWKENIFLHLHERLTYFMLELIDRERNGAQINRRLIPAVIESYIKLGKCEEDENASNDNLSVYKSYFEEKFILASEVFYENKSAEYLNINPISEYINKIKELKQEEERRIYTYLRKETWPLILEMMHRVLIVKHQHKFFIEFKDLIYAEKNNEINRLYEILLMVPDISKGFSDVYEEYVTDQGIAALEKRVDNNDAVEYVTTILKVYKKCVVWMSNSLCPKKNFEIALFNACSKFINSSIITKGADGYNNSYDLLVKYCDILLKKQSKLFVEKRFLGMVNDIMLIFKHLEDKYLFERLYANKLCNRLLLKKSASNANEKYVISQLKAHCGHTYTRNLEKILTDFDISKNVTDRFKAINKVGFVFRAQILTSFVWPIWDYYTFNIPAELEKSMPVFEEFYNTEYKCRKLNWLLSFSSGELVTNCFKNRYTLEVSTLQMAVLLQFNNSTSFTVRQLSDNIQINEDILMKILQSILKVKLLTITDKNTQVNLNTEFSNNKLKFNVNVPLKTEINKQKEEIYEYIEVERNNLIQAAIIRIMEKRKNLQHEQLMGEVLTQVSSRFKASPTDIKKNIEILIDKQYLELDEDRKTYNYRCIT